MRILDIVNDPAFAEIIAPGELAWLEARINDAKPGKPTIPCLARNKDVPAKKEEIVRQLWLRRLTQDYHYPIERITVEHPITFGRDTSKRADIVVFDEDRRTMPYIMIEVKAPKLKDGKVWLALTNLDPSNAADITASIAGVTARSAVGEVLTADRVDSINTFEAPSAVVPKPFSARAAGGSLVLRLPAKSVTVVRLEP